MAQFLTENLLLAGLGAVGGLLLAYWGVRALVALSPADIPRVDTVALDAHAIVFLLAIALLTAALFGLAPAMQATTGNLSAALKAGGRGGSDTAERNRLRGFLVASEFALAFVLLDRRGSDDSQLLSHCRRSIPDSIPPVLSMVVSVAGSQEDPAGRREVFYRQLLDRVRAIPGVNSAGAINHLPLAGDLWGWDFAIEGRPKPRPGESPGAVYRLAMPGYFETMHLPIRRGRSIAATDDSTAPRVAVINQAAARKYWKGQDPMGQRIAFDAGIWVTIVGICADARQEDWAGEPDPEVYQSALQNRDFLGGTDSHISYITLVIRTAGNPADMSPAVKQTVWSMDRNLPISEVLTMDRAVADATAQPRFLALLLASLRRRRIAAGGRRDLRCDELCDLAAHARNRHSCIAGRHPRGRAAHGAAAGDGASAGGLGGGSGWSAYLVTIDVAHALRRQGRRSADVRGRHSGAGAGGAGGDLRTGTPGDAHRSHGRATAGVIRHMISHR